MSADQRLVTAGSFTRARDADRDAALVGLREALVEGQITQDEFDSRMSKVLAATRIGQLTKLTADLQKPSPETLAALAPRPPWQRRFGPPIILLIVALVLGGIEGLTRIGDGNAGLEDGGSGGIGFPGLHFPGQPAIHTAEGMTALVSDMQHEFGTSETLRAVLYPDYAVVWMPQQADPTRVDTFYYDGNFDEASPAGTRDPAEEPLFDLADVDADAMALLVLQAPGAIGISEPTTTYAVIDRTATTEPVLGIYVSDAYVSGHLEADLDGTVTDVVPAS